MCVRAIRSSEKSGRCGNDGISMSAIGSRWSSRERRSHYSRRGVVKWGGGSGGNAPPADIAS